MSNVLLIYISGAATLLIGSAALITLSANAGRTAELAQGLGATEITQRGTTGSALLTLLRRLPFSKPLRNRISSAGLTWDVAITELILTGVTVGTFLLSSFPLLYFSGCAAARTNESNDSSPSSLRYLESCPTEPRQACRLNVPWFWPPRKCLNRRA